MGPRLRACAVTLLLAFGGCTGAGSQAAATPSATAAASARGPATAIPRGPSTLDPAVPMPVGFPADVPVYPGARLTAGATFTSSRQTAWGMEWETLDSVDKVQAFYKTRFNEGDWTTSFSGSSNGSFSAVFARRSNSKDSGLVGAGSAAGVTTITLSLVNAA